MRTIGIIGGMSWESSTEYYRIINESIRDELGGYHSAKIIMVSVDFAEIEMMQAQGMWDEAAMLLADAGHRLELAGAECIVLATNTMHKVADAIINQVNLPFLHIADGTAMKIQDMGLRKIGLLGTRFTMEESFYTERLTNLFHLDVVIPEKVERDYIHHVIFQELCLGQVQNESKIAFSKIISNLIQHGAEGIVLGCTEIGLLIKAEDCPVPVFDTTLIHTHTAVEWALSD